jgi:hypothetical protein
MRLEAVGFGRLMQVPIRAGGVVNRFAALAASRDALRAVVTVRYHVNVQCAALVIAAVAYLANTVKRA